MIIIMATAKANAHCTVCMKVIFTFERKISVSDMNTDEQTACASLKAKLTNVDFENGQEANEVVCVACSRKVQEKCGTKIAQGETITDSSKGHNNESDLEDKTKDCGSSKDQDAGMSVFQQEITVAAASAISSGTSLARISTYALMNDGYSVTCGIEVENWTRFPLTHPHVQLKAGALTVAPSVIVPATREAMVARKTSGTATGSCGTVSWLNQDLNRRLVIMWSAPYNFNHYSNWLAVGLSTPGITEHAADNIWFDQMYYGSDSADLKFKLQEYYYDVRPVFFRDGEFEVEGIMASDHKALVKVILKPLSKDHLATNIREKMLMQ